MRMGLIGYLAHFGNYEVALDAIGDLEIAAVAPGSPQENLKRFDRAKGITEKTCRYEDALEMLDKQKLDVVQVATVPYLLSRWNKACLERGIPVISDKPIAMNLEALSELYELATAGDIPLCAMHGQRSAPWLAAVHQAVHAGKIGEPLLMRSQKSYKWGSSRGEWYKSPDTFPGIIPFVGIHALDWTVWILGDVFTEVCAYEDITAQPEYKGCASQAACLFKMRNGGVATITADYLRPDAAPGHGDEQVRIAGTEGVIEGGTIKGGATLVTADIPPTELEAPGYPQYYISFVKSLQGEGKPLITREQVFRITEIALKARQSAQEGRIVSLEDSPYQLSD